MITPRLAAVGLVAVLAACGPSASPSPSASASVAEPSSPAPAGRGLPPGCSTIDLRSPIGERVDLSGAWEGTGELANPVERAWLNQLGDCVYGMVLGGTLAGATNPVRGGSLTNLTGRLGADFEVTFDVVMVDQGDAEFPYGEYSTMVMLIGWDADGQIRLREDREPGEVAGRCSQAFLDCPEPVVWYRVDGESP